MKLLVTVQTSLLSIRDDVRGQDFIEYALMAGFVALAAGAVFPTITGGTSTIFGTVTSMINVLVTTDTLPITFGR